MSTSGVMCTFFTPPDASLADEPHIKGTKFMGELKAKRTSGHEPQPLELMRRRDTPRRSGRVGLSWTSGWRIRSSRFILRFCAQQSPPSITEVNFLPSFLLHSGLISAHLKRADSALTFQPATSHSIIYDFSLNLNKAGPKGSLTPLAGRGPVSSSDVLTITADVSAAQEPHFTSLSSSSIDAIVPSADKSTFIMQNRNLDLNTQPVN